MSGRPLGLEHMQQSLRALLQLSQEMEAGGSASSGRQS
jgi:hypothetical protein